jgi:hypothetical protein
MAVATTGSADLEIQAADGSWVPLMLKERTDDRGDDLERTLAEVLSASDNDAPISDALKADIREGWSRGVGLDYDAAFGVDTLDPDYACPAGAATDVTVSAGAGAIIAMEEFVGNFYVARIGDGTVGSAKVIVMVGGTGAPTDITPSGLTAGHYIRGMCVGLDGSGNVRLYAFSSDGGTQNGQVHEYDGASWTSTAAGTFGTNGRGVTKTVMWRDRTGVNGMRFVTLSGPRKISYTKPNSDPKLANSWVEGVQIGTAYTLKTLAASRGHIYFGATDDLWDMDEVGNTIGLTSYIREQVQGINGTAVQYFDGSVFYAFGRGLLKINVEQDGLLSETPGQCAPGAFLPVEHCPRGYVTAMTTDQGWLVVAVFDTAKRVCGIFYGRSREQLGIESPNPMIWHGPLVFLRNNYTVTQMRTSAVAGDLRLWIASVQDALGTLKLTWVSRPLAGTTIQDQYAGGAHRVTTGNDIGQDSQPYSRLYLLKTTNGDKATRSDLHQIVVGSRGLPGTGASLTFYARADPAPGSDTWPSGTAVTTGPTAAITPSAVTQGQTLQYRVDFMALNGGATPPIIPYLDALRVTRWDLAPSTDAWSLEIEYGDGVLNLENGRDESRSPDDITTALQGVIGARTVIRDPLDRRRNVRLRQFFQRDVTITSGTYGKRVAATLRLDDLGAAS